MIHFPNTYFKLLKEELQSLHDPKEDESEKPTVPPEGNVPEDGSIISKPVLIYYAPKEAIPGIKQYGIMCIDKLLEQFPDMINQIHARYQNEIARTLKIPLEKILPDQVPEYLNMINPLRTKSIPAFFSRIPEGIPHLHEYLQNNEPIRITIKKIDGADDPVTIYGVNFPHKKSWIKLSKEAVEKLASQNKDFYGYFAAVDPELLFKQVPHACLLPKSGIIPPFALKFLD